MSKYDPLWSYLQTRCDAELSLSFDAIEEILSFPIDHSFLSFKKELEPYGYEVQNISLKERQVRFRRVAVE